MYPYLQPRSDGTARQLKGKGHAANDSFGYRATIPLQQVIQVKHQCSTSEDAELDSKSVQVPSLSTDDSSRASSINNHEYNLEADDSGRWLPQGDEHAPVLHRAWSPVSLESNTQRTPRSIGTLPNKQTCGLQQIPDTFEVCRDTTNLEREASREPQNPKLVNSSKLLPMGLDIGESSVPKRQSTLRLELSDSDSDSDDEWDHEDTDNDEWSGADDNIEAALYQAVYPDIALAAYMISTMYSSLVLSHRKKITRKVSSWQEKYITSCGTGSGTASTAKEGVPEGTPETGNGSSTRHDRQSRSADDNIGEDEDDDVNDSRRKRPREQSDTQLMIPKARFACHFYKQDEVKYSAIESGRKACSGPGWLSIIQLKEHLQRVHRPVQCGRCYRTFPFKSRDRSSAVSDLEKHMRQEDPCPRGKDWMKKGINDAEWSRINEDKKKNRKGKGKRKAEPIEQGSSQYDQWYEIWAVIFPDKQHPGSPYSFSNIGENDLHGYGDSGSWQKVTKDAGASQKLPSHQDTNLPKLALNFTTQTDRPMSVATLIRPKATMDRREINMGGISQPLNLNDS